MEPPCSARARRRSTDAQQSQTYLPSPCAHSRVAGSFLGHDAPIGVIQSKIGIEGGASRRGPSHTTGHTGPYHGGSTELSFGGRQSRAFGCWLRHQRFGLLGLGVQGFTPTLRRPGLRRWLAQSFLPHSVHELTVLLVTLNRSGLWPSFPARPIRCSAFRHWSASLASPTVACSGRPERPHEYIPILASTSS